MSKPFQAPSDRAPAKSSRSSAPIPIEPPPLSRSWIAAPIAAGIGLIAIFVVWCSSTARTVETPIVETPIVELAASPVPPPSPVDSGRKHSAAPAVVPVLDPPAEPSDVKSRRKVREIPIEILQVAKPLVEQAPATTKVSADAINAAIGRGVDWLRANPKTWLDGEHRGHEVGYLALPGLALLESGVDPNDPMIRKAAARLRMLASDETTTYDLSLALLFLDRLGDKSDEPLIRFLTARLIAGQTKNYGWNYKSRLWKGHATPLLGALESMRPKALLSKPLERDPGKGLIELPMASAVLSNAKTDVKLPDLMGFVAAVEPNALVKPRTLNVAVPNDDDNSNVQLAVLALWAARRHGVPVERSLLLADYRFARTQASDGAWQYRLGHYPRVSMTCTGLLCLAMGHGCLLGSEKAKDGNVVDDAAIRKGLAALALKADAEPDDAELYPLYTLWSIERVCVLYGLSRIKGKDWYDAGAKRILSWQQPSGQWGENRIDGFSDQEVIINTRAYEAPIDTSFALLFLRRSNLVQDLSDRIQLHMPIRDPDRP
jgi:hypothetical protein